MINLSLQRAPLENYWNVVTLLSDAARRINDDIHSSTCKYKDVGQSFEAAKVEELAGLHRMMVLIAVMSWQLAQGRVLR